MMRIEGHWENVDSLQDIAKIIREYYNYELANVMDKLIESTKIPSYELERLEELKYVVQQIRDLVF